MPKPGTLIILAALLVCGGCVQRVLTVDTAPQGALVFLNDQEVGRTPFSRDFTWYGTYDVEVRKEGYETLRTSAKVWAPWWQWFPMDFAAEFVPGARDVHHLSFALHPPKDADVDPQEMVKRGEDLRGQLESSGYPATRPGKMPKKQKKPE